MPDEKQDSIFVISTGPGDATSAANKKRVRSVAALKSWPERRKKTFEHNDHFAGRQTGFVLDPTVAPIQSAPTSRKKTKPVAPSRQIAPELTQAPEPRVVEIDEDPLFETCTRAFDDNCACTHCRAERRFSYGPSQGETTKPVAFPQGKKRTADGIEKPRGDLAMLTPPSSPSPSPLTLIDNVSKAEPFGCYPVSYKPWFDKLLYHMMKVFAPRGWPALKITNKEGLSWERFMTQHALSEPALFYVRLLFASGDLIRLKDLQPEISWWLQSKAIDSINEALCDPHRATSDPLILAAGRIAMHESWYGDKQAANIMHRPAQQRMIQMRGGMGALNFPPLVKRLMRWADTVMAKQSGTERMLEDEEQDRNFELGESVEVLEKWVPTEGQDLRKKIKISDLLLPDDSSVK